MIFVHQNVLKRIREKHSMVAVEVERFQDEYKDVFMQLQKQIWGEGL